MPSLYLTTGEKHEIRRTLTPKLRRILRSITKKHKFNVLNLCSKILTCLSILNSIIRENFSNVKGFCHEIRRKSRLPRKFIGATSGTGYSSSNKARVCTTASLACPKTRHALPNGPSGLRTIPIAIQKGMPHNPPLLVLSRPKPTAAVGQNRID